MPQADPFAAYRVQTAQSDTDPFASYRVQPAKPVKPVAAPEPPSSAGWYSGIAEVAKGAAKGLGHTVETVGKAFHAIPGFSEGLDDLYGTPGLSKAALAEADTATTPTNMLQRIGSVGEQAAEFLIPAGAAEKTAATVAAKIAPVFTNAPRLVQVGAKLAPRAVAQAVAGGSTAAAQGGNPVTGALAAAAMPILGAGADPVSRYLGSKAEALVLSAVKPTVASLRRIAGASVTGLEVQATKLARFILDTGATTPEKARTILSMAEQELQRVLSLKNAPTDAAERSVRYLSALEKSASKQGLPAADVATIRNAAAEVLEGSMGKDVVTMVPGPHPTLVGPNGQPITVLQPQTTRVLRTDVMADEALGRARANSQWDTKKAWGEQKGAQMEASKAVERAQRDAVKTAIPETRPILQTQGQALTAIGALDRMAQRTGNRDALSLPGVVTAGAELAGGKVPILGIAAQWLRNNQMKAGVWAEKLSDAIARQDVQEVTTILGRLGVGATATSK